jgi:hypothetical protein
LSLFQEWKFPLLEWELVCGGDSDACELQRPSITFRKGGAISVLASAAIIDHVAVADVPSPGGADPPERVLDEAREDWWIRRIELPSVDPPGKP